MKTQKKYELEQVYFPKDNDRYLSVSVFKFPLAKCGGVTDYMNSIFIPCEDGNFKYSELKSDHKKEIFEFVFKGGAVILEPIMQPNNNYWKPAMHGGNLACTSDSRIKKIYKINDRFECIEGFEIFSKEIISLEFSTTEYFVSNMTEEQRAIYFMFEEKINNGMNYEELNVMKKILDKFDMSFDYGLDADPYDLRYTKSHV